MDAVKALTQITVNGWQVNAGTEDGTLTIKAPSWTGNSKTVTLTYDSGPVGSKATWESGSGTTTINSARTSGNAQFDSNGELTITGYQSGGALLGPVDPKQGVNSSTCTVTFGPAGGIQTRMTITVQVPGLGDEPRN